jgi:DNA-binding transcriptional MerR regulator
MTPRSRALVDASIVRFPQRAEVNLSPEQLAVACGISEVRLYRLVRLGLVEPAAAGSGLFSAAAAGRLRKMLRLCSDLGVNLAGAEIIVDLLARLDRLEVELARVRRPRRSPDPANKEMR